MEPGRLVAGIPTAGSAPVLAHHFRADPEPLVWPHPEGEVRGMAIQPLHPGVPELVRADRRLYDLLALVDALRVGRARERKLAENALKERLL